MNQYGKATGSEPFQMRRALAITAAQATGEIDCSYGALGNDPAPAYTPAAYRKGFQVRWTNSVGTGRTFCKRKKNLEARMREYRHNTYGEITRFSEEG